LHKNPKFHNPVAAVLKNSGDPMSHPLFASNQRALLHWALIALLSISTTLSRNAEALTMVLDFDSTVTDIFGNQTGAFDAGPFAFSGLSQSEVEEAVLDVIMADYLGYPSESEDASSPLTDGFMLDIAFEIGSVGTGPLNGDLEYYYMAIGTGLSGAQATNQGIFGGACYTCVRTAGGAYGGWSGAIVGSIFTDHIDNIAYQAVNDVQLINLIAGTISHEIGHTLSLGHEGADSANPGESTWGVMGTGASVPNTASMPNSQRFLDRDFTYDNMTQLIGAVGLTADTFQTVQEPGVMLLFMGGLIGFGAARRRRTLS
jgi:hypothetical protein